LLEVKGWFEGVDHQREALDRLLPTIRAASDPIMRDLYLKKVSERTGVSREVLQEQAARPAYGSADRSPPAPESRYAQGTPVSRPPAKRRKVDAAERDLLRVLIKEPGWRARAAQEVPADWFETPELREVFQAITGSPETVESGLFLEHLSPGARRAWAWLDSIEPKYGSIDPDVTYADAWRALEVRPLRRQLAALERGRTKPVAALTAADLDALVAERHRLITEISSRFPEELLKRPIRRGKLDAR
jgi:hypothetical protein